MIQKKYYWGRSLKAAAVLCCLRKDFPLHMVSSFKLAVEGSLSVHTDDQEVEFLRVHLPGIYDLLPPSFVDESFAECNIDFRRLYRINVRREQQLRQYFSPLDVAMLSYQQTWYRYSLPELIFQLYDWAFKEREVGQMLALYDLPPGTTGLMILLGDMVGAKMWATETFTISSVNMELLGDTILGECCYVGSCYLIEVIIMRIIVELPFHEKYTAWLDGGSKRRYLEELLACKVPVEWEIVIVLVAGKVSGTLPARLDFDLFVN